VNDGKRRIELPEALAEHGFTYGSRLQSRGAEASLHLVSDANGQPLVLKVYHQGAPKLEILERLRSLQSRYVNPIYAYGESLRRASGSCRPGHPRAACAIWSTAKARDSRRQPPKRCSASWRRGCVSFTDRASSTAT
jgi:hypothetical protein